MKVSILFMLVLLPASARAASIQCDHSISGAPFASVGLDLLPDGSLGPVARITTYGKTHEESVTQEPNRPGERFHLWISKENPNNAIEMMIFEGEGMPSKMINPNLGWGREITGSCREIP